MQKLIAKKTAYMEDGKVFVQKGNEYTVLKQDGKFIHVHTDISDDHMFYQAGTLEGFYGNYFLLEGETLEEEIVEVETPEELPEEVETLAVEEDVAPVRQTKNKRRK